MTLRPLLLASLFSLSSVLDPVCALSPDNNHDVEDVSKALSFIHGVLLEQVACLQAIESKEQSEAGRARYEELAARLLKSHEMVDEHVLALYLSRLPEQKQLVIEALQALADEIARLRAAKFYGNAALQRLLLPPLAPQSTSKPAATSPAAAD